MKKRSLRLKIYFKDGTTKIWYGVGKIETCYNMLAITNNFDGATSVTKIFLSEITTMLVEDNKK